MNNKPNKVNRIGIILLMLIILLSNIIVANCKTQSIGSGRGGTGSSTTTTCSTPAEMSNHLSNQYGIQATNLPEGSKIINGRLQVPTTPQLDVNVEKYKNKGYSLNIKRNQLEIKKDKTQTVL